MTGVLVRVTRPDLDYGAISEYARLIGSLSLTK
jgi:hypothetical protein